MYWFVPALVVLVDQAAAVGSRRERLALLVMIFGGYAVAVFGVVSFTDFGTAKLPTDTPGEFVIRNLFVLLALLLIATLPTREDPTRR